MEHNRCLPVCHAGVQGLVDEVASGGLPGVYMASADHNCMHTCTIFLMMHCWLMKTVHSKVKVPLMMCDTLLDARLGICPYITCLRLAYCSGRCG